MEINFSHHAEHNNSEGFLKFFFLDLLFPITMSHKCEQKDLKIKF